MFPTKTKSFFNRFSNSLHASFSPGKRHNSSSEEDGADDGKDEQPGEQPGCEEERLDPVRQGHRQSIQWGDQAGQAGG